MHGDWVDLQPLIVCQGSSSGLRLQHHNVMGKQLTEHHQQHVGRSAACSNKGGASTSGESSRQHRPAYDEEPVHSCGALQAPVRATREQYLDLREKKATSSTTREADFRKNRTAVSEMLSNMASCQVGDAWEAWPGGSGAARARWRQAPAGQQVCITQSGTPARLCEGLGMANSHWRGSSFPVSSMLQQQLVLVKKSHNAWGTMPERLRSAAD